MASGLILVSGLGRCGTSLMMQMLSAGGWPVFEPENASWPDFENEDVNLGRRGVPAGATGLLKWLDPQRVRPPRILRGSIFLTRDAKQQTLSTAKLLGEKLTRSHLASMAESYRSDTASARQTLRARGPLFELSFERLVSRPHKVLEEISAWLGDPLDIASAVIQLRPRETGPDCLPYLIEGRLLREGQGVREGARAQGGGS